MFSVVVLDETNLKPFLYVDKSMALEVAKALAVIYDTGVFVSASDENCFVVGEKFS